MMTRRDLIKTLTLGAAGLTLGMSSRQARAAASAVPRRVVFIYTPQGLHSSAANRAQNWVLANSAKDFTPVGMAAPMARHKSNMVMFNNLAVCTQSSQVQGGANIHTGIETHIDGKAMILTNTDMLNFAYGSSKPVGESLDMFLARQTGKQYTPAWPSLQLGVVTDNTGGATMTYQGAGAYATPVPTERSPLNLYNNLFGSVGVPSRILRRKSVLDTVSADMPRFLNRLSAEDKARAAVQVDALQTLEQRLGAGASCPKPTAPNVAGLDFGDGRNGIAQADAMMSLITAAFACDLTRVVSLVFQGVFSSVRGGHMGSLNIDRDIHDLSHDKNSSLMINAKTGMFEKIAALADQLAAIPEGQGSMLDNTLIVHVSEETDNHSLNNLPYFTVGGRNMGVQVGSYLDLPTVSHSHNGSFNGFAHGCLWRSVIAAMGLPEQAFGTPEFSDRLVPGFLG